MNEVKFKANIKDVLALQAEVAAIPEIPTPETTDEGKVLTVAVDSSGETPVVSYELDTPSRGLPAITAGDAGKVLTVNAGETAAEWAAPSGGKELKNLTHTFNKSNTHSLARGDTTILSFTLENVSTFTADDYYIVQPNDGIIALAGTSEGVNKNMQFACLGWMYKSGSTTLQLKGAITLVSTPDPNWTLTANSWDAKYNICKI